MTEVILKIDGKLYKSFNDPSDAWDYFIITLNLPSSIFTIRKDIGWSWDKLPFRFGWNGKFYEVEKSERQ